jgi:hypothetical protein
MRTADSGSGCVVTLPVMVSAFGVCIRCGSVVRPNRQSRHTHGAANVEHRCPTARGGCLSRGCRGSDPVHQLQRRGWRSCEHCLWENRRGQKDGHDEHVLKGGGKKELAKARCLAQRSCH